MTEITESEIVMRDVVTQKDIHQMGIEVAGVVIMTVEKLAKAFLLAQMRVLEC